MNGDLGNVHEARFNEFSRAADCDECRARRCFERAVCDLYALTVLNVHQPFPVRERLVGAVENKTRKRDVIARNRRDQQSASLRERQRRCSARAENVRSGRQFEIAHAVDARRKHERRARFCRFVQRALQSHAVVFGRPRLQGEISSVLPAPWCRDRSADDRYSGTSRQCGEKVATIETHARAPVRKMISKRAYSGPPHDPRAEIVGRCDESKLKPARA